MENILKTPVIDERDSHETHVQNVIDHIEQLLKEGSTADEIIDYINVSLQIRQLLLVQGNRLQHSYVFFFNIFKNKYLTGQYCCGR